MTMKPTISRRRMLALLAASSGPGPHPLTRKDDEFLEELSHRAFLYFWERASPRTGLVLDRARNLEGEENRQVASSAATGFGLTGLCIAAERGWMPRETLRARVLATLRFYARTSIHEHGWFYHFVNTTTGERFWKCEVSSIDTALLLAGVLTAKEYFRDSEVTRLADEIYQRIDFRWMLNGHPHLLAMGWHPESGFLNARWDHYCELLILYLMGIGSPTTPLAPESWNAWRRPRVTYAGYTYISGAPTLFTHQYSHAWIDFRGTREETGDRVDWFQNSIYATMAHRQFCIDIGKTDFPGCYDETSWGITASDSATGYVDWGGPPRHHRIDGTVVPCAAGGSLMFEPKLCVQALMNMRHRFGSRIWGRYGFADAFHPVTGWTDPDVIGIDVGITLLAAENARSGNIWKWFMRNPEIRKSMSLVRIGSEIGQSPKKAGRADQARSQYCG